MTERRFTFEHDGHRFDALERATDPPRANAGERRLQWVVWMDGNQVLEFQGEYPYRDADVRKRVIEWYGVQKPAR